MSSGRAKASPRLIASSVLISRDCISAEVSISLDPPISLPLSTVGCQDVSPLPAEVPSAVTKPPSAGILIPLYKLCVARSGDKGNTANIAIISRAPSTYSLLQTQLTPELIHAHLRHVIDPEGSVTRYLVPGVHAMNFVVTGCLGGGGLGSLRLDKQGKGFAQVILSTVKVMVPERLRARL
jgi:hypothetical protein